MRSQTTTKLLGLLTFATCLYAGCAAELTQSEIKALETRELDLPRDEAYRAAANGLFSLGFIIDHSEKESGLLSGKRTKKATKVSVTFLLFFPLPTIGEGTTTDGVSLMVTGLDENSSQLRMKYVKDGIPIVDRALMTEIWQMIEREGMLEARPASATIPSEKRAVDLVEQGEEAELATTEIDEKEVEEKEEKKEKEK